MDWPSVRSTSTGAPTPSNICLLVELMIVAVVYEASYDGIACNQFSYAVAMIVCSCRGRFVLLGEFEFVWLARKSAGYHNILE